METRANYVIVGIFTLAAILAAFAFVYWTAAIGDKGETTLLRVRIPGSASGLGRGSFVLFNGVKVGDVRRVYIDVDNPTVAIADTEIDRLTPITKSTQADIGLAGLTGQANIELKGADPKEVKLLDQAEKEGKVAEIVANPSAVTNLLQTAQNIFTRADTVLSQLEGFTKDVRGPLTQTVQNVRTFSEALAKNSDGIDKFLASVSSLSDELKGVSGKLDSTLTAAEGLLKAVDKDQIRSIVANVDTVTSNLKETSKQFDTVINNVNTAVGSINDFAQKTQGTLAKVDGVLDGIDPAEVRTALANIQKASENANQAAADIAKVTGKVADRADDVAQTIKDARQLAQRLDDASVRVDGILAKVDGVLDGIDPAEVRTALANIQKASENANQAAADIAKVTGKVADRADDVAQTIKDARQLAQRLDDASVRVDGILAKVDALLGSGQADGVMADARATLQSFKQVADTLNARLGVITDNLARFSGSGLQNVEALVQDSRRSINRIEEAVTDLSRNPQRILSGGDGEVRQFDGRVRR